jgi:hypothetical protein
MSLTNGNIYSNTATSGGGGIVNGSSGGVLTVTNSAISSNTVTQSSSTGAGMYNSGAMTLIRYLEAIFRRGRGIFNNFSA